MTEWIEEFLQALNCIILPYWWESLWEGAGHVMILSTSPSTFQWRHLSRALILSPPLSGIIFSHWAWHFSIHWPAVWRLPWIGLDRRVGTALHLPDLYRLFRMEPLKPSGSAESAVDSSWPSPVLTLKSCMLDARPLSGACPGPSDCPSLGQFCRRSAPGVGVSMGHSGQNITADPHLMWLPEPSQETFWMHISLESASC